MDVLLTAEQIQKRVARAGPADCRGLPRPAADDRRRPDRQPDLPRRPRSARSTCRCEIGLIQASSYRGPPPRAGRAARQRRPAPRRPRPPRPAARRHPRHRPDPRAPGRSTCATAAPLSVRVAVLLRKLGRQEVAFEPDYFGFDIPDAFVVGYGLDYNDDYRHLPYIAMLRRPSQGSRRSVRHSPLAALSVSDIVQRSLPLADASQLLPRPAARASSSAASVSSGAPVRGPRTAASTASRSMRRARAAPRPAAARHAARPVAAIRSGRRSRLGTCRAARRRAEWLQGPARRQPLPAAGLAAFLAAHLDGWLLRRADRRRRVRRREAARCRRRCGTISGQAGRRSRPPCRPRGGSKRAAPAATRSSCASAGWKRTRGFSTPSGRTTSCATFIPTCTWSSPATGRTGPAGALRRGLRIRRRRVALVGERRNAALLKRAEVVWSPGRVETRDAGGLEAMAAGKPVVASNIPRLAELVGEGETGFLVPPERQGGPGPADAAAARRPGPAPRWAKRAGAAVAEHSRRRAGGTVCQGVQGTAVTAAACTAEPNGGGRRSS